MTARAEDGAGQPSYSDWLVVDQALVNRFADAIHDHQFIHTDPVLAKDGPYGGTIAHGFLALSLLTHFTRSAFDPPKPGVVEINYGFDKVRFLAPVPVGAKIRARFEELSSEAKGQGILRRLAAGIEIEGHEKPALAAEWLVLILQGEDAA